MTAIVIGHQLFSASASKLAVFILAINGFNAKTERVQKPKNSISPQRHRFRFQLPSSTEIEPKFSVTAQAYEVGSNVQPEILINM